MEHVSAHPSCVLVTVFFLYVVLHQLPMVLVYAIVFFVAFVLATAVQRTCVLFWLLLLKEIVPGLL